MLVYISTVAALISLFLHYWCNSLQLHNYSMVLAIQLIPVHVCFYANRLTQCKYKRIGCPWQGPFHELSAHEVECSHPSKTGIELMGILDEMDQSHRRELQLYNSIFSLLSFEKIGFTGTYT